MLRRGGIVLVALAIAGSAAALPGLAKGKRKHTCKVDVTALVATVKTNGGNPPDSGSNTSAGTIDGKICGKRFHGAVRGLVVFTGAGKFKLTNVTFGPKGSTTSKGSGVGTLNSDGSVGFSGTAKIVRGTGDTKGATGSYKFTGTQSTEDSSLSTQHVVGTLKY